MENTIPVIELEETCLNQCRLLKNWESVLNVLPKNAIVAEVGVDTGKSSEKILRITKPQKLHLIDISFGAPVREIFSSEIERGIVEIHQSDSVAALKKFPNNYFDWIFIDGDHSYQGVKRDADLAKLKIKKGGLLIFDDYIFFDHYSNEFYGVVQAVNELCITDNWNVIYFALQKEMFCKIVIQKNEDQNYGQ